MSERDCYRGKVACPSCGSRKTGTDTIATSARFMDFGCDDCGAEFKVRATKVSSLSRTLSGMARGASAHLSGRGAKT